MYAQTSEKIAVTSKPPQDMESRHWKITAQRRKERKVDPWDLGSN